MKIIYDYDRTTTIATATATPLHLPSVSVGLVGTGVARLKPGDHYDPRIGQEIAAGRAIADLGNQIADAAAALSITDEQATQHALMCLAGGGLLVQRVG